jgi:uncharacterized membrane protein YfcA
MIRYKYRLKIKFPYTENDIKWDYETLLKYNIIALFSGILCSSLGVSGGAVLGPILMHYKIHPIMLRMSCNFLVVLISFSSSFQFSLMGIMNLNYGIVLFVIAIISGIIGSFFIDFLIKRYGRPSIVLIILTVFYCLSLIVMLIDLRRKIKEHKDKGMNIWGFISPCS